VRLDVAGRRRAAGLPVGQVAGRQLVERRRADGPAMGGGQGHDEGLGNPKGRAVFTPERTRAGRLRAKEYRPSVYGRHEAGDGELA
jgi:hypothetical protein